MCAAGFLGIVGLNLLTAQHEARQGLSLDIHWRTPRAVQRHIGQASDDALGNGG
jgi:hypothetical protein